MNVAKKKVLPSLEKCLFLASSLMPILIGLGFYNEYSAVKKDLIQSIRYWTPDLAQIYSNQDWLALRKIGLAIFSPKLSSLSLYSESTAIFSIPQETRNECFGKISIPISHYGVHVGDAIGCISFPNIAAQFLSLNVTTTVALSIFIVVLLSAGIPLLRFRAGLENLTICVNKWNVGEIQSLNAGVITSDADSSFLKVIKLFESGMEKRLLAQKQIDELTKGKELGEIAAQVAHDVKAPLTAIDIIFARNVLLPREEKEVVDIAILRIKLIVRDLLEKTRETSDNPLSFSLTNNSQNPGSQSVCSVLKNVLSEMKPIIEAKKINITTEITIGVRQEFLSVSPTDYSRVFSNLLSNAIDAVDSGGTIIVNLKRIKNYVTLEVLDNGKGIPPEVLTNLGKRRATFGKTNGTGLGLYFIHTNLRKWGGRVKVRSRLGRGTIMRVSIPHNFS